MLAYIIVNNLGNIENLLFLILMMSDCLGNKYVMKLLSSFSRCTFVLVELWVTFGISKTHQSIGRNTGEIGIWLLTYFVSVEVLKVLVSYGSFDSFVLGIDRSPKQKLPCSLEFDVLVDF